MLTATLAASCLVTAVWVFPHYLPYVSPFGMKRPLYWLMSDSNVDWNHALPEVNLCLFRIVEAFRIAGRPPWPL